MSAQPPRVISGIQPTGELHLGNYFGAIANHIALQDEYPGECFYFIADYHALTTVHDAASVEQSVREVAQTYLALGLDPARATLFRQSDVPEVTELTWLLMCVTGMGLLERAHAYKDKTARGLKASMGLFCYPVLMAADILLYGSSVVPVGKDQLQHVEMAQDMATYVNEAWGAGDTLLRRPEPRLSSAPYVVGLDGQKMSKSYHNTIPIFASGKPLRKLTGRIVTDSTPLGAPLPGDNNVTTLLNLFLDQPGRAQARHWFETGTRDGAPFGYGHGKELLAQAIDSHFAQARERREALLNDAHQVDEVLRQGAARARSIARETIAALRKACGLAASPRG